MAKWAGGPKVKKIINNHGSDLPETITINVNVVVSGEVSLKQDGSVIGSLGLNSSDSTKTTQSKINDLDILPNEKIFNVNRTKAKFGNSTE